MQNVPPHTHQNQLSQAFPASSITAPSPPAGTPVRPDPLCRQAQCAWRPCGSGAPPDRWPNRPKRPGQLARRPPDEEQVPQSVGRGRRGGGGAGAGAGGGGLVAMEGLEPEGQVRRQPIE